MRWLYQRASFALTSWRERAEAALRCHAALLEWALPYRGMRSVWLWWVASMTRGKPGLVAVRRPSPNPNPHLSPSPSPDLGHSPTPLPPYP